MNNTISETISLRPYSTTVKSGTAQRSGANSGFLDLLAQTKKAQVDTAGFSGVGATEAVSLESMLKAKYPGLTYHVLDQSTSCWRTRNDYPHYLLYQDGEAAEEKLKNWKPIGANPFYGSIDGRFTAPQSIHALGSLPPGSKAVAIHPKVQERMEQDPEYAKEIFARIDAWFTLDVARNEAIMPGSTWDMSQAVAIGEDGNICNACSSSPGKITFSRSGSDGEDWWERRMKRSKELMELNIAAQIERAMAYSKYLSASSLAADKEKSQLTDLLTGGNLRELLGDTVVDMPTDDFLSLVGAEIGLML